MANEKDEKIRLLEELVSVLQSQLADRESTIREQNILVAELRATIANLNETIDEFRRKFFGKSSEKTSTAGDDEEEEKGECITVRSHSRKPRSPKSKREDLYGNLLVNEVRCDIPEDQRICPDCDAVMEHLGYKFVREELVIIPAKVFRVRYMQETLFCPVCRSEDDTTIKAAVVPKGLLPHSPVSASILAELIYQKSVLHVPFYRQEPIWKEKGCPIPRGTMASWYNECTSRYITPIYDLLHQRLKERDVLHVDETTCQVLHEEGRKATSKSYMWIYTSGTDGLPPIAMYDYQQGRGMNTREISLKVSRVSSSVTVIPHTDA